MMELGNQVFGHNNEHIHINRDRFQDLFIKLCEKYIHADMHLDSIEISNDVFEIRPYYWGDCECDYDKKSEDWSKTHFHQENCYTHDVKQFQEELETQLKSKFTEQIHSEEYYKEHDRMVSEFVKKWNVPFEGWGVHCTCQYEGEWIEFLLNNDHAKNCHMKMPNFWYKPTNLRIDWYKYPLRDSYSNREFNESELKDIFKKCNERLNYTEVGKQ